MSSISGRIVSQALAPVKELTFKSTSLMVSFIVGACIARYAAENGTSPTFSVAQPIYHLGKTLCDTMIIHKQAPTFLQLSEIRDQNGNELLYLDAVKTPRSKEPLDVPKEIVRGAISSAGGLLYLLSKGIDKCAEVFSKTFVPEKLQKDLHSTTSTQNEILQKMEEGQKAMSSNIDSLKEGQTQQTGLVSQLEDSTNQQSDLIEKVQQVDTLSILETDLKQAEAVILGFIDQLGQIPSHEKRVELIKKIVAEIQVQEGHNRDLQEQLQSLSKFYAEEVALVEKLTDEIEKQIGIKNDDSCQ